MVAFTVYILFTVSNFFIFFNFQYSHACPNADDTKRLHNDIIFPLDCSFMVVICSTAQAFPSTKKVLITNV